MGIVEHDSGDDKVIAEHDDDYDSQKTFKRCA